MKDVERLLHVIVDKYIGHTYHDTEEFMSIVDIIEKYPKICFQLLSGNSLMKKERIPLLRGCITDEKVFNDLCQCKAYIRRMSIEEQNIILNNSSKDQIFTIVNTCTSIGYHPDKLIINEDKQEFVTSALLMKKLAKS